MSRSIIPAEAKTVATASSATVSAWRCASSGMRRLNPLALRSPRISATITNRRTAKVVTLMPPAVPALPPPMNISTSQPSSVSGVRSPMSTVLKPELRG